MSWQNDIKNYFYNAFTSWDNYHKYGIIPNLWAGITGQKSQEMQTNANIEMSNKQFADNLDFQTTKYQDELAFQREQLNAQNNIANQNLELNRDVANRNFDMQQQAFDYQKQLNATQMEREDTALQRQIADAQAAGLSPLSVLGGSGASSTPLSSGSAPQMDLSGVNGAVGQYLDIARQYASLHAQATQNYMNGRNQAAIQHNSQVLGARTALAQMKADMHYKGQNMATQYFNAAVNASNARLQRDYMREQIKTKKYENNWYDEHGYNPTSLSTVVSDFLNRDSTKKALDAIGSIGDSLYDFAEKIVSKGSQAPTYHNTYQFFESPEFKNVQQQEKSLFIQALEDCGIDPTHADFPDLLSGKVLKRYKELMKNR